MPSRDQSPTAQPPTGTVAMPARWRWWGGLIGLVLLLLVVAAWYAPDLRVGQARAAAKRDLAGGAVGAAVRALDWAASARPRDWRTDLELAACHRQLGEKEDWQAAVQRAAEAGAEPAALRQEQMLGAYWFGEVAQVSRSHLDGLMAEGASPRDALAAVIHALLAAGSREARDEALLAVDQWRPGPGEEVDAAYLRGLCLTAAGDRTGAQNAFRSVLTSRPLHEMAKAALGRSLEEQYRLAEALPYYREVFAAAPNRESARLDLARVLRKLGRLDDARRVMEPLTTTTPVSPSSALAAGEIDYESGNYRAAAAWFERADLEGAHLAESLRSAGSNLAYFGEFARSAQLFARIDDAQSLSRQRGELERRVRIDPGDTSAAEELKRLAVPPDRSPAEAASSGNTSQLFIRHCSACHGGQGDGNGVAARFLFPRPRNLRDDPYRLVGTQNQVPSLDDIELVIGQGIPGTSMPAFDKLTFAERKELAQCVERFYRTRFGGAEPILPSAPLAVPVLGEPSTGTIARGQAIYERTGCLQCHGADGTGAGAAAMFDDEGRQTVPRNLVHEPLKGGRRLESLYRRIRLGMPGTPHPAATSLSELELSELVHYCRSLEREQTLTTNHQRSLRTAGVR